MIAIELENSRELRQLQLDTGQLQDIFNARRLPSAGEVAIPSDTPADIGAFIRREHQAAEFPYRALVDRAIHTLDPWLGRRAVARHGHLLDPREIPEAYYVPLAYRFSNFRTGAFWLLTFHPAGRLTHLYLPRHQCIIYHHEARPSPELGAAFMALEAAARFRPFPVPRTRTVAVIDLIANYAHQCMNTLGGLARLAQGGSLPDQIWVAGVEFFPPIEILFPELAPRVRRFASTARMVRQGSKRPILPLRPASNICERRIVDRIYELTGNGGQAGINPTGRWPVLAVAVRAGDRICRNLPELVDEIFRDLVVDYPRLAILVDGFVIPEGAQTTGATGRRYQYRVDEDREIETRMKELLPDNAILASTLGHRMMQSLTMIRAADVYLSGIGTLQHKLSFFGGLRGVVHGPVSSLRKWDSGHFQIENGHAPLFPPSDWVEDEPGPAAIASRSNYHVTNSAGFADLLRRCIREAERDKVSPS